MTNRSWSRTWRSAVAAGVLLAAPSLGYAQEDCADISGGAPIIYGAGGSAQAPLVGRAATVLQSATDPIYVVYKDDAGACSGIDALTGLGPTTISGTAKYWDETGTQLTCNLELAGDTVEFASMGNSPLLCPLVTEPSLVDGIVDVTGPISSVNILVPNASTQQSISAEAFYLVYGFGPAADIAPWNNASEDFYIHRNENSYVQLYLAEATGLPVTKFFGVDAGSNSNSIALLGGLANPEQGIAFASGEVADANRANVRTLAYQHTGQNAGYWPDSSATAFDKINVRNGTYFLWGPGHFYGLEGASEGVAADPNVAVFLDFVSGAAQPEGTTTTITEVAIANKNVPQCAMHVTRDGDLSPVYAAEPAEPCHCFFEFSATGTTTCETCDDSTPCATGTCRFGYCEAN